ncbi:hypothetical protein [Staphylococcus saprophyticus]|nr:hypothetical protein [Staphylococcus saprophyticus]
MDVVYGSESGNGEEIGERFERKVKWEKLNVDVWDMDDFGRD